MRLAARRGTKRPQAPRAARFSNDLESGLRASRHNCRHAFTLLFAFAMMSPPPSPLFPLGGRPCLSISHTLTVCPWQACVRVWGVQPRSERPALPRRAARIRGGPSCDSKNESPTIEANIVRQGSILFTATWLRTGFGMFGEQTRRRIRSWWPRA